MCSVYSAALLVAMAAGGVHGEELRVCADPNNLPFSNSQRRGFENELASMVARDLHRKLVYHWAPQRGRYLRKGLNAGKCDVLMGVVTGMDQVLTTRPYYRSSYVFVARRHDPGSSVRSFDDPSLRRARIGVHVLQNDDATVPPVRVLINRGLSQNIEWYKLYPDFVRANPQAALIEAVEGGEVDLAVVWGPLAGYFAQHAAVPLTVRPVPNQVEGSIPLAFSVSMAVRRGNTRLLSALNGEIERRKGEIEALLRRYGVPAVSGADGPTAFARR